MKPTNRIHQLAFEVNFAATPADEQALPVWIQENLLPVIDQVMQQLTQEVGEQTERSSTKVRKIRRVEKLEIDLGTVTQAESATELQRRLHSQLFNALAFEFTEKNEASLEAQEAYIQETQLLDFLSTGRLSWLLEQHGKHAHKHLLNQVLNQPFSLPITPSAANTRFEKNLSQITQNDLQLTRLVRQFDTPELFQIIKGQLQRWPNQEQELILDWISLELLNLSNLSAVPTSSAAIRVNSKGQQQEKFWKHVLKASQQHQSWQSLIMSWLTQRQQTADLALNYYRQTIERDATLSNSTRAALNLVLNNFHQHLGTAHAEAAQDEIATTKDLAWSDAEVDALRELIIASRTHVHLPSIEDAALTLDRNKRLNSNIESNGSTAPEAIIHALKIADFEALAVQWPHLLFNQTKLIRTLQESAWQLWLRNFKPVHCLEIACVLQTRCAWFIARHQQRILDLAPAERDHLLVQLLTAKPDSLNVSDLLNSPHLASRFEARFMQKFSDERGELQHKNIEELIPSTSPSSSPSDDLHRLLQAWPALLQKPKALLALFYRHKQQYLHSLPICHLLEVAQIAFPAIFQIWQANLHLISKIEQHPKHESSLRNLLQSLFSTSPDAITSHAFIDMLSEQIAKDASAGFMLQWINEKKLTSNDKLSSQSSSESILEQNLASQIQATLDAAIESCLQIDLSALFKLRPTLWRHWLAYAGEAQQLKLARQFQVQLSDFFSLLEGLSSTEKKSALAAALPLLLATLPGEIKLVELISGLHPDLQAAIKFKLSTRHEGKNFDKNDRPLLTTRAPDSRPHSDDEMIDEEMIDEEINFHKMNDSISDLFFRKDSNDFIRILPPLMLQRSQEFAQFWRDLQRDQQEQCLTQLDFDTKVDLLALLYPELAQGLHQTIKLLENAALSSVENSSSNENAGRQSSDINTQPSTDRNRRFKIFVIAIDNVLISDKHNATTTREIIKKFSDSLKVRSVHAGETRGLKLAREFQAQLSDGFPTSGALTQADKVKVVRSAQPLSLTELMGELRLIQQVYNSLPSFLQGIKREPSATSKPGALVENAAALLTSLTTDTRPRSGDKKLDTEIDTEIDVKIDFHQQKELKSDLFFRKNSNDFRKTLSNLMLQRSQELLQFWRDLQQDQQEQWLTQLDFDSKVGLLALFYPELADGLHQTVSLLKSAALSRVENSSINDDSKRQSSDIGIQTSTASKDHLKNFLIEIDKLLVSDKHNATSAKEILGKFFEALQTRSTHVDDTQKLEQARQFQTQLDDNFLTSKTLTDTETNRASNSTPSLMLTALLDELRLVEQISESVPSSPEGIKREQSPTNEPRALLENAAQFLTPPTTDVSPLSDVEKLDTKITFDQQSEFKSAIFFRKNSNDFRKNLSNLFLQRHQELTQVWRELQRDQQEECLMQLDFGSKVNLLALLYPELSEELDQTVSLLRNAALSPLEKSSGNVSLKRQSSDIGVRPSTASTDPLKNFLIEIDNLLVSNQHNLTSVKEMVKKFSNGVRAMSSDLHRVSLEQILVSKKSTMETDVENNLNANLYAEMSNSDKLDTIWTTLFTNTAEGTKLDSTPSSHLLNPLLQGFRSWKSRHVRLSQLMLTLDELEQYLHWWILEQAHRDSENSPENYALMLNSIKRATQECTNPELFMQLVLDALRDDQTLDLEMFKTQVATMLMTSAKLHRSSHAPTGTAEKEDFLSQFGELSYDKTTIEQEFPMIFDFSSNRQDSAEFKKNSRAFIQQFSLALSDPQETHALFAQLQRDPDLLKFLNTAQLHQLLIARFQSTNAGSQFAKMSPDIAPLQILNILEHQAYYRNVSRDFLLAVWHKLSGESAVDLYKLLPLLQEIDTDDSEYLYQSQYLSSLFRVSNSTENRQKDRLNLTQALREIFKAKRVTTSTGNERKYGSEYGSNYESNYESERSITPNIARSSPINRTLSQAANEKTISKTEDSSNKISKISAAEHKDIYSQEEFIPWFQSIQAHLQNQAFKIWTIEWLGAHAQSAPHHAYGDDIYEISDTSEPIQEEGKEENTLVVPENFALILCVMHQALPPPLYQNWQRTAIEVFSLDQAFWEKLSQHPFQTSSELYQACSNSLADTTWISDRKIDQLHREGGSSEREAILAQIDRNTVSSLPPQLREALPHKLAQAMLDGHLQSLDLIWDEIRLYHVDLLRQAQARYLKNVSLREKLILRNPANRLLDLIAALSQSASVFLKELWQAWDICRSHLNPKMDLAHCQKQSIRAAFSYLLNHPHSESRPGLILESVLLQLLDTKIHAKFLPDLLGACLRDLNAGQSSQSSQLLLAMYEITQKNLLLENLHDILEWQATPLSDQLASSNEASLLMVSAAPIVSKAQVQSMFVQAICMHAPQLIEDLFTHTADDTLAEDSNGNHTERNADISTEITSGTKLAKINASDYPSIWNTALHNSTKDAQEKFWNEYGKQLQLLAHTDDLLQTQESALNKSLPILFAANRENQNLFTKNGDSSITKLRYTSSHHELAIESEGSGDDFTSNQQLSFDKLSLLLQTRRDLSLPEQKYLTLSLSRLHAADKLAWTNFVSTLRDAFSLERYLQVTKLHDLDRLFNLLRPELAMGIKDIIKRIEIIFDVPLSLNATLLKHATWRAIYRAEFIGAQAHHYQDFLIKLFSELAHGLSHSLSPTHRLPPPDICLKKLYAYKPEANLDRPNTDNDEVMTETADIANKGVKINDGSAKSGKDKTNSTDSIASLNHESHVLNAGMVIVAPYAQRLFGILELTQNGSFVSDDAAQRAVHLLQYVVTGETQTPEFQLTLNKLLCGIHGGIPIVAGIEITAHEQEVIEQMLHGVITHWSALGNTSIQGLRDTFLRRQGYLYFEEDSWKLKIPQGGFDMLLDQLPWSFAMIKFPWMQEPLHVTWR